MDLKKISWKEAAVFLMIAVFILSGVQSAIPAVVSTSNNTTHISSPSIEKQMNTIAGINDKPIITQSYTPFGIANPSGISNVSFIESGLNPGLSWGVYIFNNGFNASCTNLYFLSKFNYASNNYSNANTPNLSKFVGYNFSSGTSLNISLPNGTYYYDITVMNSTYFPYESGFATNQVFTVQGYSLNVSVSIPTLKKVDINAQGLVSGIKWTIALEDSNLTVMYYNSSFSNSIVAYLPLGNYTYSYTEGIFQVTSPNPSNILVKQTNTTIMTFSIQIMKTSLVTFDETGLTPGFKWKLIVLYDGTTIGGFMGTYINMLYTNSTANSKFSINIPNGTYTYTTLSGSYSNSCSEALTTNTSISSHQTVNVKIPLLHKYTFNENGLSAGSNWGVLVEWNYPTISSTSPYDVCYLNGSDSSSLTAYLPNGTLKYTPIIGSVSLGYSIPFTGMKGTIFSSTDFTVSGIGSAVISFSFPTVHNVKVNVNGTFPGLTYNVCVRNGTTNSLNYTNESSNSSFLMFLASGAYTIYVNSTYGTIKEYYNHTFSISTHGFTINMMIPIYKVTVVAYGLHEGMYTYLSYTGNFSGNSHSSNSTFYLPNGTYSYIFNVGSAGPTNSVITTSKTGEFNVTGNNITVKIHFPHYYKVYLKENGFTNGGEWGISLTMGLNGCVANNTIVPYEMIVYLTNGTYSYSFGTFNSSINGITNPTTGSLTISAQTPQTITLKRVAQYYVYFSELGLPSSIVWSVNLNGTLETSNSSGYNSTVISFHEPNGTYSYAITPITGYSSSIPNGTVVVNGGNVTKSVSFTSLNSSGSYNVNFYESGLPSGKSWTVELNGAIQSSTTNTISYRVPNGTYSFYVYPISGYTITPQNGNLSVAGHNFNETISFSTLSTQPPVWAFVGKYADYNMTFSNGTSLNAKFEVVSVNASNDTVTIDLSSTNTNFKNQVIYQNWNDFGFWLGRGLISQANNNSNASHVSVTTPAGTFMTDMVSANNNTTLLYFDMYSGILIKESFTNSTGTSNVILMATNIPEGTSSGLNYSVKFTESGLPSGTAWYVNLSNGMKSGAITGTSYSFSLANGTYSYNIGTTDKTYHANAGTIKITGSKTSQTIHFSKYKYTVTFTESGLPSGTQWNVTLNGSSSGSSGTSISFTVINGSYSYKVSSVSGYTATNGTGTFSVNGPHKAIEIKFSSSNNSSGLSSTEIYAIVGISIAIIAILGAVVLFKRK